MVPTVQPDLLGSIGHTLSPSAAKGISIHLPVQYHDRVRCWVCHADAGQNHANSAKSWKSYVESVMPGSTISFGPQEVLRLRDPISLQRRLSSFARGEGASGQ